MIDNKFISENNDYDTVIWGGIKKDGSIIKETDGCRIRDFLEIQNIVQELDKFGFMGNGVMTSLDLNKNTFEINNNNLQIDILDENNESIFKNNNSDKLIGFRIYANVMPTNNSNIQKEYTLSYNYGYRVNNDRCNCRIFVELNMYETNKLHCVVSNVKEGFYTLLLKNNDTDIFNKIIKLEENKNNITLDLKY